VLIRERRKKNQKLRPNFFITIYDMHVFLIAWWIKNCSFITSHDIWFLLCCLFGMWLWYMAIYNSI